MSEKDIVQKTPSPLTVDSLAADFASCGLAAGQTVLVHSAMGQLGWVTGGPVTVIQALLRVLGDGGTLMIPAHTGANGDPANWQNPPVPESWWPIIREHRPAYDPAITPTRGMGVIAELFRTWPGVIRSPHPVDSFAATGPNARTLLDSHTSLESPLGDDSPVGRLYDLDGYVLLLGVGHGNNTSLHLAEERAVFPGKKRIKEGTAMFVDGQRQWVSYETLDLNDDDFATIGDAYEAEHHIPRCRVGLAEARFMKQRPLVDFAVRWMEANRDFRETDA